MFQVALFLALAATATAFQNRAGRTADVRVFNFLDASSPVSPAVRPLISGTDNEFVSGNVRVLAVFGANEVNVQSSVASGTTPANLDFQRVDVDGSSNNLRIELTQGGLDGDLNEDFVCTANVQANKRNTIIVTQNESPSTIPTTGCSNTEGSCQVVDNANIVAGTVSFTCQVFTENLDDVNDCSTDPVAIFRNDDDTCPVFVQRESLDDVTGLASGDIVFTGLQLADSPQLINPIVRDFDQTQDFSVTIDGVSADLLADAPARRHEVFCGPGVCRTAALKTAFVTIINGHFRTNVEGTTTDNTYSIEIRDSSNKNVHFRQNLSAGQKEPSAANAFIELPLNGDSESFNVIVYDNDESITEIFGIKSATPAESATATQLQSGSSTLTADSYTAIVLNGGSGSAPSTSGPTVSFAPLSSAFADEGTTDFEVFNFVNGLSLEFAAPDSSCCNFLDFNEGRTLSSGVGSSRTINSAALTSSTFASYNTGAGCATLSTFLIESNALTLTNTESGSTCASKAVFLLGRRVDIPAVTTTTGSSCSECSAAETLVTPVTQVTDGTNSDIRSIEVTVPLCGCNAAAVAVPCSTCEIGLAEDIADVSANVDAVRASVSTLSSFVSSELNDLSKQVKNAEKDIVDEVEDVGSDLEDDIKKLRN